MSRTKANFIVLKMFIFKIVQLMVLFTLVQSEMSWNNSMSEDCKDRIESNLHRCVVSLPQNEKNNECKKYRIIATEKAKMYYQLSNPSNNDDLTSPLLTQSSEVVGLMARLDDLDSTWFSVYYTMVAALNKTKDTLEQLASARELRLTSYQNYKFIYDQFYLTLTKKLGSSKWFQQPLDDPHFFDITEDNIWQKDKYFTQRRLAGQCPYHLRQVNKHFNPSKPMGMDSKYLYSHLNEEFDWDTLVSTAINTKTTLKEVICDGALYVLHHEDYNDIPRTDDIATSTPYDKHTNNTMLESPSPIALFILNEKGELDVLAIQINYKKDSEVITPNHENPTNIKWMRAKAYVEIADMAICQLDGHLVNTHRTQEMFCNLFRRSLSPHHPLFQLMTIHCQGTTPVGALGISALIDEHRYMHKLFDFGHLGTKLLINRAYDRQDYEDSDLRIQLKKRGLDNDRIKYYPYRDDGIIIWKQIQIFAKRFVNLYYKNNVDVIDDKELQAFVNELSTDGLYSQGGKYKGFPATFKSKTDVSRFLTRFIWLVVLHAANSYPLLPNGAYLPIMPTKLYDSGNTTDYAEMLPDLDVTLHQEVLTFTLSGFRMNRLFTYSKLLNDPKARRLVQQTEEILHTCVQEKLEKRNKERYSQFHMTYQYMEPKFLPNSIHS